MPLPSNTPFLAGELGTSPYDVEGNRGRDPRQEVSAGTLPVSVELPARYEDYSLARKKRNQAFSLILVCVALASICTELD